MVHKSVAGVFRSAGEGVCELQSVEDFEGYRLGNLVRDVTYDAADRIVGYTHYDAMTAAAQPALDQSFGYDEAGRLTSVATAAANWGITYDANGNRTALTLNGASSVYTTEVTSNRLTGTTNPGRSFSHDEAGNTLADSANYTATYDASGRLSTLTKSGITTTYSYNGLGQRIRKFSSSGPSSTAIFVYDRAGQLLGEYSSTGAVIREYVWLGSTPLAMFEPNGSNPPVVYHFHVDHLDTPRVVTDTAGNVRWRWLSEPFGTTLPEMNPSGLGAIAQNLRFPGQYADAESGLFYNYYRDYDATTGRYAQSDPVGIAGGINTYTYVEANPLRHVDPLGLWTVQLGFSVSGAWMPAAFGIGPQGQVGVGVAFDGNGNVGAYWTAGGGAAVGSTDIVGGVQGAWSNGSTICDLGGVSNNVGINAGFGFGGTVDTFGGSGTQGQAVGGVGITLGGGVGVAGYGGKFYTGVKRFGSSEQCTCK